MVDVYSLVDTIYKEKQKQIKGFCYSGDRGVKGLVSLVIMSLE